MFSTTPKRSISHSYVTLISVFFLLLPRPRSSTLFPYTTLFRSDAGPLLLTQVEPPRGARPPRQRSEEHTSELQSRFDLVCRLLLEKKNFKNDSAATIATVSREAGFSHMFLALGMIVTYYSRRGH